MRGMVDTIYVPVAIAIAIIMITIVASIYISISNELGTVIPFFADSATAAKMNNAFLYIIFAVYLGIPIVSVILALLSSSHPALIPLSIIFLLFSGLISIIMKIVIVSILPEFSYYTFLSDNQLFLLLIEYMPFIMIVFASFIIIAQYVI